MGGSIEEMPAEGMELMDKGSPEKEGRVQLRRELGVLEGVSVILGIIIGSGIFVSPKGVLEEIGSVGAALLIWVASGFLALIGALCYAELGTAVPKSGGDYAYIREAFGPLPSFLFLWDAIFVFVPTTNAIMALTFAKYVLQPFFPSCENPEAGVQLLAALAICLLTFINCWNMKLITKVQDVFMFTKVGAIIIIIIAGMAYLFMGHTESFEKPFEGTKVDAGKIAIAFYQGIYSYAGWNYLNFMTEELRDPYKSLPRAIYISLPVVTFIYVLANVAYLAVLPPPEMRASEAIAVTFGEQVLGVMYWVMPVFVAVSSFGSLCVHIMTSSRLCFVGAREGMLPQSLALISIHHATPALSLVFLGILSLMMLFTTDIYRLIEYSSFVESFFITLSILSLLYLRWKRPDLQRPIKVNLLIPLIFLSICTFLVVMPLKERPFEVLMAIAISAAGVPIYFIFVYMKKRPQCLDNLSYGFTCLMQKVFFAAEGQKAD